MEGTVSEEFLFRPIQNNGLSVFVNKLGVSGARRGVVCFSGPVIRLWGFQKRKCPSLAMVSRVGSHDQKITSGIKMTCYIRVVVASRFSTLYTRYNRTAVGLCGKRIWV